MQAVVHAIGWLLCAAGCLTGLLTFFILMLAGSGGNATAEKGMRDAAVIGIFAVLAIIIGLFLTLVVIP
jgi:hypothetical protein